MGLHISRRVIRRRERGGNRVGLHISRRERGFGHRGGVVN